MNKKFDVLSWELSFKGKRYGSKLSITSLESLDNPAIREIVEIISQQMVESIQRTVNGKSDSDIKYEEIKKRPYPKFL